MDLLSEAPKQLFFTTPGEWIKKKTKKVTYNPSANYYITQAHIYGLNWGLMWCISYVATEGFRDEDECYRCKSYFNVKTSDGSPFKAQTWHDGVALGIQLIAAHAKVKEIKNVPKDKILFPGTFDAMKSPLGLKTVADLDKLFGAGFAAQVQAVYDDLEKFANNDEFQNPPTDADPIVIEPVRPDPIVVKPPPAPKDPNAPEPTWKKWVKIAIGVASPFVLWLVGFVVPGPIMDIVKSVIAILKQLVGA